MDSKPSVLINRKNRLIDDYFKVDEAYIQHRKFDGKLSNEIRRLNLNREDVCSAILYDKEKEMLLLVKQFRFPVSTKEDGFLLEIPAGVIEKDEEPEVAMKREIFEETGYKVDYFVYLFYYFTSPGITSERCFLYFAEINDKLKLGLGGGCIDEDEEIQIQWIRQNDIISYIESGKIVDAKTIVALYWFLLNQRLDKK